LALSVLRRLLSLAVVVALGFTVAVVVLGVIGLSR
jgi:hypothetical protein